MAETSSELLARCATAIQSSDFPTVWQTVLRGHRLVAGAPLQHMQGGEAQLRIPLLTGQFLVFNSDSKRFSIL